MADYDDNIKIQIRISEDTPQGKFNDAIYLTQREFADMVNPSATIAALKKDRVDRWLAAIEEAKTRPAHVPTEEELAEQEAATKRQLEEIQEKLEAVRSLGNE